MASDADGGMSLQPAALPYIGNEAARRFLLGSWRAGRLAHAYLFVGPRQVGRRTVALWLARLVNCDQAKPHNQVAPLGPDGSAPTDVGPCDRCSACRRIMHGNYPDVMVVEPEVDEFGEVKRGVLIEQIREVVERRAPLRPYEGRVKVFVIRGADTMTPQAANAFLKTLEEPPAATLFVLTAADQARLLPTIVSRCQTVTLRPVPIRTLAAALAAWEDWPDRDPGRAELYARLSGRCPGAAVLATQQPDYLAERQHWLDQVNDLVSADRHQRLATVANMTTRSAAAPLLDQWLTWWRDLLLLRSGSGEGITHWDQHAVLANLAARLRPSEIAAFLRRIEETRDQIERNANVRLAFEVLVLDMPYVEDAA